MRVRIGERWELRRRDASNWELYHLHETADNKQTRERGTAGRVTWHGTGRYYQCNTLAHALLYAADRELAEGDADESATIAEYARRLDDTLERFKTSFAESMTVN